MADSRKLKVYEGSSWNYKSVPEIILKGNWLKQYRFTEDTPIHVLCEDRKLTITPRDPDPIPEKSGISFPRFRKKSGGSWRDLSKEHIKNWTEDK